MEQRAFNLEQPKPKRKYSRNSPKRKEIKKYVRQNPLADAHEIARACNCSTNYVYSVAPRSKLKRKLGHEQLKRAAKRREINTVKPVTVKTRDDEWDAVMQLVEEEQSRGEPAFNVAEASTMQVGGDHYRQMQVQPWDAPQSVAYAGGISRLPEGHGHFLPRPESVARAVTSTSARPFITSLS